MNQNYGQYNQYSQMPQNPYGVTQSDLNYMQNVANNSNGPITGFTAGGDPVRSKGCCSCFSRQVDTMQFPVQQQYATQNFSSMEFPMELSLENRNVTSYSTFAKMAFALGVIAVAYLVTLG